MAWNAAGVGTGRSLLAERSRLEGRTSLEPMDEFVSQRVANLRPQGFRTVPGRTHVPFQMGAFQAQPPVVVAAIPVHQTVGQALGILGRCTTLAEQGLPRHEGVQFLPVHGAAVRPGPAVGVGGGRIRSRSFGVRHSPVDFLNMPLGVG